MRTVKFIISRKRINVKMLVMYNVPESLNYQGTDFRKLKKYIYID